MRLFLTTLFLASTLSLAACGGGSSSVTPDAGAPGPLGPHFVHTAGFATRTAGDTMSRLDHPNLDGNPNAIVIATYNETPRGGIVGNHFDSPYAVEYVAASGKWYIRSLGATIPDQAGFNVSVFDPSAIAFVHTSNPANSVGSWTEIDHPALNSAPDARILTTMRIDGSVPSMAQGNPRNIGVYYHPPANQWTVFNQNRNAMPANVGFNVVLAPLATSLIHETTAGSISAAGDKSWISSPLTDDQPRALIHMIPVWRGIYHDHAVGISDSFFRLFGPDQWSVSNEDRSPMPVGLFFVVARFE